METYIYTILVMLIVSFIGNIHFLVNGKDLKKGRGYAIFGLISGAVLIIWAINVLQKGVS